ncbi:hypothetical protein ACJX0J_020300, partial [Zea mays]
GKPGDKVGDSAYYRSLEKDLDANELFGRVQEIRSGRQRYPLQSPQTASGLHWQHGGSDNTTFMPNICRSSCLCPQFFSGARPRGEPALRRAPPDAVRQPHQPFEV